MIANRKHRLRTRFSLLILLGLSVRVVTPAGYMPAPIDEGGPFILCPGGLSGALILSPDDTPHHHHGADADEQPAAWEFCPFGAVFGASIPVADPAAGVVPLEPFLPDVEPQVAVRQTAHPSALARGPPPRQPLSA